MEISEDQAGPQVGGVVGHGFRGEAGALLRLGAPIAATQLCVMGMGFLDTAMAGRYGAVDLAGVSLGGVLLWPVFMLMSGITMAVMPMVSQLVGARRTGESGPLIRHGLWIALFSSVVMMLAMQNAEPALLLMGADPGVTAVAAGYLKAASWGMPAMMTYILLRQVCEGLGHTLPPMLIAGTAFVLNAPLQLRADLRRVRISGTGWRGLRLGHRHGDVGGAWADPAGGPASFLPRHQLDWWRYRLSLGDGGAGSSSWGCPSAPPYSSKWRSIRRSAC